MRKEQRDKERRLGICILKKRIGEKKKLKR